MDWMCSTATATAATLIVAALSFNILSKKIINTRKWTGLKYLNFDIRHKKTWIEEWQTFFCFVLTERIDEILVHKFLTMFVCYGISTKKTAKNSE